MYLNENKYYLMVNLKRAGDKGLLPERKYHTATIASLIYNKLAKWELGKLYITDFGEMTLKNNTKPNWHRWLANLSNIAKVRKTDTRRK
jgi:hypothetical protein